MKASRIPDFAKKSRGGMSIWFAEMSLRGLLFHPEDAPSDVFTIETNERTFTPVECAKLDEIMAEMFALFGDDVCEAAYPIFMKRMGMGMQQAA
jgi:hypothetical protein